MNRPSAETVRAVPAPMLVVVALLAALITGTGGTHDPAQAAAHVHAQQAHPLTAKQLAFHDQMRKLWEDHVTWTRLAIVSFADGSAGFGATAGRLLRNQSDIGKALSAYYGVAAGERVTALLHDHITIAVELLQAAEAGDGAAFEAAHARWSANADEIAASLASLNPESWPRAQLRAMMRTHLDQTLTEAADELGGDYAGSVATYEEIHRHILVMADVLSAGIMHQFPKRFRG